MSRNVMPHLFALQAQQFEEFTKTGQTDKALAVFLKLLKLDTTIKPGNYLPVKLRWVHSPSIGLPRQPFTIYRTPFLYSQVASKSTDLMVPPRSVSGTTPIEWGRREMFFVTFNAQPAAGQQLIIEALDVRGDVIPFQRFVTNHSINARFRSPGIAALSVKGTGTIQSVRGITQHIVANEPQWQRFAVVGLPFETGETPDDVYSNEKQGVWVQNGSGREAALIRLEIERLLQSAVPTIPDATIPTPSIGPPNANAYLNMLRDKDLSPLRLIAKCLGVSDDADFANLQVKFKPDVQVRGLRQADITPLNEPDKITANIPVVATTMLSVGSDSFAATGLGYGMVDFIPKLERRQDDFLDVPGLASPSIEYMAVATFTLPFFGKVELAALNSFAPEPDAPANASATRLHRLRPNAMDDPELESVKLRWDLAEVHQGYIAGVSRTSGTFDILNEKQAANLDHKRIIPPRPARYEGDPPADQEATYVDPLSPVPFNGSTTHKYALIGQDVFSRWARWAVTQYTSQAPDVHVPAVQNIVLQIEPTPLSPQVYPASLEIVFAWDWSDRSPRQVEFYGRFDGPALVPSGGATSQFQLIQGGPLAATLVVRFQGTPLAPVVLGGFTTTIEELDAATPPPPGQADVRRYRLTVHDLHCTFVSDNETGYSVRARGSESRRPGVLSDFSATKRSHAFDPGPPAQPALPAELHWTALPDATGIARGVLEWPAIARARGYVIWESTETTLRQLIDPTRPDPSQTTSLPDRATELRDMLAAFSADDDFRMRAFSRLNTELIATNSYELSLPGQADTIYTYQISAVGENNLESPRSDGGVFFAVPKHMKPSQPSLMLRKAPGGAGIKILALPGAGRAPVGYRIHRVRTEHLVPDIGTMGPPIFDETAPGWAEESVPARTQGGNLTAQAITDPVAQSWYPYYYRAVALGEEDLIHGKLRGESEASISQVSFNPPAEEPVLIGPEMAHEWRVERDHSVGSSPRALAFHARLKLLCVTNYGSNTVSLISVESNRVVSTIPVRSRPWGVAVDPASEFAYVSNYLSGSVSVVNLRTRRRQREISGMLRPTGLVHSARHNRVFVTDTSRRQLVVIDTTRSRIERRISLGGTPYNLALDTSRAEKVLVADYSSGRIIQIDAETLTVDHAQFVGGRPYNIAVHSGARLAFICDITANMIVVLDLPTLSVQARWATSTRPVACYVDEGSNKLFVATYTGRSVDVFDIVSGSLQQSVQLRSPLYDVLFVASTQRLYATKISTRQVVALKRQATATDSHFVFTFQSDLPTRPTPLGEAWIALSEDHIDASSARVVREQLLRIRADAIPPGAAFELLPTPSAGDLAAMPEIRRTASSGGVSQYSVRMRLPAHENGRIALSLTDPLNRVTESIIQEDL